MRAAILGQWRAEFNLSQEQIGYLLGAGLFPFAISIILFSLIIDRLGNGVSMAIAFTLHALSAVITVAAPLLLADPGAGPDAVLEGQRNGFSLLYIGTFIFALGNGTIEAVVNPVTATLYDREKTKYLNMLHAGWPGGLVLGGLVAIAVSFIDPARVPGSLWQWQVGLVLVPTLAYGLMLLGQRFPVQERVAANVPYYEMLREFGAGSCFVVCFFLVAGLNQILVILGVPTFALAAQLGIALVVTLLFAAYVRSFGRPMFILLLLIMVLLATTELGTDSWISDIMHTVLESPTLGTLFLVWTSLIMFVLRFFAGPIVHRIGPLGLLAASAAVAAVGLLWLSTAGTSPIMLFAAATFYGVGKTFFWPTTLGVVSEQYPRGGALMLNAIAGVGMISVGTIGNPAIGAVQDRALTAELRAADPALARAARRVAPRPLRRVVRARSHRPGAAGRGAGRIGGAGPGQCPAGARRVGRVPPPRERHQELSRQSALLAALDSRTKQATLGRIALLPVIMLACYLALIAYFRKAGGYRAERLVPDAARGVAPQL